jgi:hypothetical protein
VSAAPHSVRRATMERPPICSNPPKINAQPVGLVGALSLALLQQQEVTNYDPYQSV